MFQKSYVNRACTPYSTNGHTGSIHQRTLFSENLSYNGLRVWHHAAVNSGM